jgi:NAD(P)-dependent dehydrogenase (short-subunit alcohol dehydrogenase family)
VIDVQNLKAKTAIVTGGASGIGLGIGKALLAAGMNVAIGDVQEDALRTAEEALGNPDRSFAAKLDVTDRAAFSAFTDAVEERFGHIHLLANNAGVVVSGPIEQATFSDWDWVIDVNLRGAANGIVTVLPRILAHGEGGHILNTASTSGLMPHPGATIYATTKAALIGMSEALRGELEPRGVIVSVLCPGPAQSGISASGRNRPCTYASSGYLSGPASSPGECPQWMMSPDEVGELVRTGIERDLLYILTHSEHREGLEQRTAAIMAAVPNRPQSEEIRTLLAVTLKNRVYVDEIARQREQR